MTGYVSRAQAARHAQKQVACFRCTFDAKKTLWHWSQQNENNLWKNALSFAAKRDYISHVEQHDSVPVFVVTCLREEILEKLPHKSVPITRSLWEAHAKDVGRVPRATGAPAMPRKAGATKRVWEIADENTGATRQQLIAICVAEGIAAATAGTQMSKWKKSKGF